MNTRHGSPPTASPRGSGTARVLVVEDSEAIREMVVEALVDAGYVAGGRVDGAGLEDVLEAFRPDLVVLDVMLPGRDGFTLIDVVRGWRRRDCATHRSR